MGRASRRKKTTSAGDRTTRGAAPQHELSARFQAAADATDAALDQLEAASSEFFPAYRLRRPYAIHDLLQLREHLEQIALEVSFAEEILTANWLVPELTPRGKRWTDELTPRDLIEQVRAGGNREGRPYAQQLDENRATEAAVRAKLDAVAQVLCGRGNDCQVHVVTLPQDAPGPACWRHLTTDEKASIGALYARAVTEHACLGCSAPPGEPCDTSDSAKLEPIDGRWPRVRSFLGQKIHKNRLDELAPA
ncbi:hypothetical protein GW571_14765 (plasmid) [Clavibacter capsici]|uniref:Uncharacterized protein n=1 Tax=Clavibacter capsici TaxID=1874630 RepID=A0A0M3RS42_9MICO|nr:hypothetical protein [Clavibacter capsici]ALD14425.1 hypothetical protein AES38_15240 [Clavibacter capsici]QIS40568.1 hypothetical protein GW572_15455 [Clavibacter capsici]QIS43500.1 hypothetical protein GW571_14765 [Clavibacter capsici]QIS46453.1 hypothetical protein GW570_14785 [Clavibacter capsici]